jgi:hypothetical protein
VLADIWVESKPNECEKVKDTTGSEGDAMIRIMRHRNKELLC